MPQRRFRVSRPYTIASTLIGVGLAIYVTWSVFELGGSRTTDAVEHFAETAAAIFAAGACLLAAIRSKGRLRGGWWLLAAAATSWSLGSLAFSPYAIGGVSAASGIAAHNLGESIAIVLVVSGLLTFPSAPSTAMNRVRATLNGAIIAVALLFSASVFGLGSIWTTWGSHTGIAYLTPGLPLGDGLALAVLVTLVGGTTQRIRIPMILLACALAAVLLADIAFANLSLKGAYSATGSPYDIGWVVGYALFGLAALWPDLIKLEKSGDGPAELWQLALPWIGAVTLIALAAGKAAIGHPLDVTTTALADVLGTLFVLSQALVLRDTLQLNRSAGRLEMQLRESTGLLREVIDRAPLGIARFGLNLHVIDTNPQLCELLHTPMEKLVGSSVTEYLAAEDFKKVMEKFENIRNGSTDSAEGESQIRRPDGTGSWLHWTVAAVRKESGSIGYFLAMYEDITAHKLAEIDLEQRTALLNAVIANSPVGISRLSPDLTVLDVNPKMAGMLDEPANALLGSSILRAVPPAGKDQLLARIASLARGEVETLVMESHVLRRDGTALWMRRTLTAVRTAGGQVDYYLVIAEDATERHRLEELAAANVAGLERLSKLKSEFMSMVSHEFRTALTGILGYSELMTGEGVSPEEVKEFSGDINSDALRLNRMITEMLDLDRIESGRITLNLAPLDLNQILADAAERAGITATKHAVKTDLDPTLPMVEADSDRVIQVVTNLLSNAIKYSPDGGDVVVASRFKDGNAEVTVQDHGPGIPAEFLGKIFGRYERYEGAGKVRVVGTGLGLAIAQQIIQLHKGRIWVESTVGSGSEFRFTIPVRVPAAVEPAVLVGLPSK